MSPSAVLEPVTVSIRELLLWYAVFLSHLAVQDVFYQ